MEGGSAKHSIVAEIYRNHCADIDELIIWLASSPKANKVSRSLRGVKRRGNLPKIYQSLIKSLTIIQTQLCHRFMTAQ